MTDLTDLLDRASDLDGHREPALPIADDLARARAALRRRRRRHGLVAVGSACVIGVLAGVGGPALVDGSPGDRPTVVEPESMLFAAGESAGPYTFGKLPRGWEVQGAYDQGVTIAPVGFADQEPLSFAGKLVIMYDQNPPSGEATVVGGREFFAHSAGGGMSTVAVRTRDGEPQGVVSVQYPDSAGWTVETMIEFLDAVEVGQQAQPGVG